MITRCHWFRMAAIIKRCLPKMAMATACRLCRLGQAIGWPGHKVVMVFPAPQFTKRAIVPWKSRRRRSEEHTSELQSLMRTSYAVFCLIKKISLLFFYLLILLFFFSLSFYPLLFLFFSYFFIFLFFFFFFSFFFLFLF